MHWSWFSLRKCGNEKKIDVNICFLKRSTVSEPVVGSNHIVTSSEQHPRLFEKGSRPACSLCHRSHSGYVVHSSDGIVPTWASKPNLKESECAARSLPGVIHALRSFESFQDMQTDNFPPTGLYAKHAKDKNRERHRNYHTGTLTWAERRCCKNTFCSEITLRSGSFFFFSFFSLAL